MIEAGPGHAAALAEIHAAAFPPAEAWRAEDFAVQLRLPGVTGLIHPDGGLILTRIAADEAEVLTLGVVPTARRRGIGRLLLERTLAEAQMCGAAVVFLEVAANNLPALRLYRSVGFHQAGLRKRYYTGKLDAVILRRALTQPEVESPQSTQR